MKSINPSGSRVNLSPDDSVRSILRLVADANLMVLRFYEPLPANLLRDLNADFFSQRPDVELRAYGFPGKTCDLSFCSLLPNVRRFSADCLMNAVEVHRVVEMPLLESLGIGIWNLDSFEFLSYAHDGIVELLLTRTKSKKPDLKPIRRFKKIKKLYLEGQQKNIELISDLSELEDLTLRSITVDSLDFLRPLPNLSSFDLKLGGTSDLSALTNLENLKYLELWQILGLDNIEVVSTLTGLERLFLQSLSRIISIPTLDRLVHLRKIHLEEMKGLEDISALATAPALEELRHVASISSVNDYLKLLQSPTLKAAHVGFGSWKKNLQFKRLCDAKGIANNIATRPGIVRAAAGAH